MTLETIIDTKTYPIEDAGFQDKCRSVLGVFTPTGS